MSQHKRQLHDRVLHRQSELLASRDLLETEAPGSERLQAVDAALSALELHMSGDWNLVDDSQASILNKWIEASDTLIEPGVSENAEMIFRRLETRVRLDEIGLPAPLPTDETNSETNHEAA